MAIPPKKRILASADAARLVDVLKDVSESAESVYKDIEDCLLCRSALSLDKITTHRNRIRKLLNEALFHARRMEQGLGDECPMNCDTILAVHENQYARLPKPDEMTTDTNLGRLVKDGFLIPRFGLTKCLESINSAKPKDNLWWINESRANKCFGFRGSEANFLKSWMNLQYYYGTKEEVETYGILVYDSRKRAFKYSSLKDFAERYYREFFLWQVELLRLGKRAFVVDDGEKYLLRKG